MVAGQHEKHCHGEPTEKRAVDHLSDQPTQTGQHSGFFSAISTPAHSVGPKRCQPIIKKVPGKRKKTDKYSSPLSDITNITVLESSPTSGCDGMTILSLNSSLLNFRNEPLQVNPINHQSANNFSSLRKKGTPKCNTPISEITNIRVLESTPFVESEVVNQSVSLIPYVI